jgi:hypothetical protein
MDSRFNVRRRLLSFNLASVAFFGIRSCNAAVGSATFGSHFRITNGPTRTTSFFHFRDCK